MFYATLNSRVYQSVQIALSKVHRWHTVSDAHVPLLLDRFHLTTCTRKLALFSEPTLTSSSLSSSSIMSTSSTAAAFTSGTAGGSAFCDFCFENQLVEKEAAPANVQCADVPAIVQFSSCPITTNNIRLPQLTLHFMTCMSKGQ